MDRDELLSNILTHMAKDDNLDFEFVHRIGFLSLLNEEIENLMISWYNSKDMFEKKKYLIAMDAVLKDWEDFGLNGMYGKE